MFKKIVIIIFSIFVVLILSTWFSLPDLSEFKKDFSTQQSPTKTIYLDRYGKELSVDSYGDHFFINLDNIPAYILKDLVFFEDQSFWSNPGISVSGILRAALSYGKEGGGSTITQQFFRNFINWKEKSILRKWVEIIGAIKLSLTFDKRDILTGYINNTAYFYTRNLKGLDAGARYWFSKPARLLTRAEGLMLITMLNGKPSSLEKLYKKYQSRINRLIIAGKLSIEDTNYETILRGPTFKLNYEAPESYSTFIDNISEIVLENGNLVGEYFGKGLIITTTLDKMGNDLIYNIINNFASNQKNINNVVFLMFNPKQELIYNVKYPKSYKGYFDVANSPNVMPGSRAKIISYALAIESLIDSGYSINAVLNYPLPTKYTYANGKIVNDNYNLETVPLKTAISLSLNAPALYAANHLTTPFNISEFASYYNIHWKPYESLPLGTQGISEVNLLKFYYSILINESKIEKPIYILKIKANSGNYYRDIYNMNNNDALLKKQTLAVIKKCLIGVVRNGTAKGLNKSPFLKNWEIAVKTGTSPKGKHLGITGIIGKYSFSLLVESKKYFGSSEEIIILLKNILEQLVGNGFIEN